MAGWRARWRPPAGKEARDEHLRSCLCEFQTLLRAEEGSNSALVEDGASIKDDA
jgi:hypothetical protein